MKYRKRPVVIEAHEWSGGETEGIRIVGWINERGGHSYYVPEGEHDPLRYESELDPFKDGPHFIVIETLEGCMRMNPGDFAIEGIKGEHYPCEGSIFRLSYEAVEYGEGDS